MSTTIFSTFLSKIAPTAVKAEAVTNSRAVVSLWQRYILGQTEDEEEEIVEKFDLKTEVPIVEEVERADRITRPVDSPEARGQLLSFLNEMRQKSRTGAHESNIAASVSRAEARPFPLLSTWASPQITPVDDLRVPVGQNMVHLAQ